MSRERKPGGGRKPDFPELGKLEPFQRKQRERGEAIELVPAQVPRLQGQGVLNDYLLNKGFRLPTGQPRKLGRKPDPDTVRSVPLQQQAAIGNGRETAQARSDRLNPDAGTQLVKQGDPKFAANQRSFSLHLHGSEQAQRAFMDELDEMYEREGWSPDLIAKVLEKLGPQAHPTEYTVTMDGKTYSFDPATKKLTPTAERPLQKGYTFRE
jgi:hypothetical protein